MLADRLGIWDTGTGDGPCTLQVPQASRQILMRKHIVISLCSVQDIVHEDQGKAKRQNAD